MFSACDFLIIRETRVLPCKEGFIHSRKGSFTILRSLVITNFRHFSEVLMPSVSGLATTSGSPSLQKPIASLPISLSSPFQRVVCANVAADAMMATQRVNTFFIFESFSLTMFRFIIREEEYWFLASLKLYF